MNRNNEYLIKFYESPKLYQNIIQNLNNIIFTLTFKHDAKFKQLLEEQIFDKLSNQNN